jgi:hypothetical protein
MAIPRELIDRLAALTERGKLAWEQGPLDADSLRTSTASMTMMLKRNKSRFSLAIYDDDGNLLDREEDESGGKVSNLYEAARRRALDVDNKFKELEVALTKLERD